MMVMDLATLPWLRADMDDEKAELIRMLYSRVGMAMEDASIIALELGGPRSAFDKQKIAKVEASAATITRLLQAARSLQN
jgi:hypothetical protein